MKIKVNKIKNIKKILIIEIVTGVGDIILSIPVLKALRKGFPSARITLLCDSIVAKEIVEGNSWVDEIIMLNKRFSPFLSRKEKLDFLLNVVKPLIKLRMEKFDLSIWTWPSEGIEREIISLIIGAKYRIGHRNVTRHFSGLFYNINVPVVRGFHRVEQNLNLLRAIGFDDFDKTISICISEHDKEYAKSFLSKNNIREGDFVIGFHPGGGQTGKYKIWGKDKFALLGNDLYKNYGAKILVFLGPDERELLSYMKDSMPKSIIIVNTTLRQTAALIENCDLFVCNDSGLMHVSAAVNTPTIAIFGPTDPKEVGPWDCKDVIIKKNMSCSPCLHTKHFLNCIDRPCLKEITVEDVMDAIEKEILK